MMQHHNRPTGYTPPIYPSGVNSIEARVKALEVSRGYEAREMDAIRLELGSLRHDMASLSSHAEGLQRRAAVWVIGALLAACSSLLLIVVKLKAPWLLTP